MQLLVLGASGKTGKELTQQGFIRGHKITAFVRDPSTVERHAGLRVVMGDVTDARAVHQAMAGQDAVLCALGQSSPFKRDPRLTTGMRYVVEAMEHNKVRRIIYLSFAGVRSSRQRAGWMLKWLMVPALHAIVADHEARENVIKQSGVDWTMVRAVHLTSGPHTGNYRYGEEVQPLPTFPHISRADMAELMLRLAEDPSSIHKGVLATY